MTRDVHLGGSGSTGRQTDDVMLSSEVKRYRKLKLQEYQQLFEDGDLEALLHAMDDEQRLLFASDCVEHLLTHLAEQEHPLVVPAYALMRAYQAYVHGKGSRKQVEGAAIGYAQIEAAHISTVIPHELVTDYQIYWTLSNVVEMTLKGQPDWASYWASAYRPYEDYYLERALHYLSQTDISSA